MGEGLKQMFHEVSSSRARDAEEASGSSSASEGSDGGSLSSASSGDDEAASPPRRPRWPSSPVSHLGSEGPLHELSSLVAQLPIRKGLSKYYQGKSQSFTSLSEVRSVEDLPKKEAIYRKKVKPCKSYAGGLDEAQRLSFNSSSGGKPNKPKKSPRASSSSSCASLVARSSSTGFLCGKPPAIPMHRNQ